MVPELLEARSEPGELFEVRDRQLGQSRLALARQLESNDALVLLVGAAPNEAALFSSVDELDAAVVAEEQVLASSPTEGALPYTRMASSSWYCAPVSPARFACWSPTRPTSDASAAAEERRVTPTDESEDEMADVTETQLPGVGVRHEFATGAGERVAVLSHRTGRREIAVYDRADPDSCTTVLHLNPDDTRTLAELLGGAPLAEAASGVQRVAGVALDWIPIRAGSAQTGATIGDGQLRTRAGASVVAVIRGDETVPAPGPEMTLEAGDVVVAAGTPEGLRQLRDLLEA